MSLLIVGWNDGDVSAVFCSRCGCFCFTEENAVISDMALRDVVPLCWHCDTGNPDTIPAHLYFLDDHYLLGVDDRSFLAEWKTDDLEIRQDDLKLIPITSSAYYSLKTGDIRLITPLSSWTKLHKETTKREVKGQ